MILRCLCGAAYSLKDEPVRLGESFECEECGGEVSVPPLHGVIQTDGMVTIEGQPDDSTKTKSPKPRLTNPVLPAPRPATAKPRDPELTRPRAGSPDQNASEVKALLDRLEKLSRDNITLHLKVAKLEKELSEPGGSKLGHAADKQSNARRTNRQEPDYGALREEFFSGLKSLSSGLVELKQAWVTHAEHRRDHEARHASLQDELADSNDQIEKLTKLHDQISSEKDARIADLEKELATLRDEASRLTASRAKQIRERDARIARLEETLEATRKEVVDLATGRDEQIQERDTRIAELEKTLGAYASYVKEKLLELAEQLDTPDDAASSETGRVASTRGHRRA